MPAHRKLTDDEIIDMAFRYEAGMSMAAIGREFGVCVQTVSENLSGLVEVRDQSTEMRLWERQPHQNLANHAKAAALRAKPAAYWSNLYHRPPYPSAGTLARDHGVCVATMCRILREAGIRVRSSGGQTKVDFRQRRRPDSPGKGWTKERWGELQRLGAAVSRSKAARARMAKVRQGRPKQRVRRFCDWCGREVYRYPSVAKKTAHSLCGVHCRAPWQKWRLKGRTDVRPLIVQLLQERWRAEHPDEPTGTLDGMAALGITYGASEEECIEALLLFVQEAGG
jgi:hypothetical protein